MGSPRVIERRPLIPPVSPLRLNSRPTWFIARICFSVDGADVFGISKSGTLSRWDARTGKIVRSMPLGDEAFVIALSPDGKTLAVGGNSAVRLLESETLELLEEWPGSAWWFCFSSDSRRMVYGGQEGVLVARDIATGNTIATNSGEDHIDGLVAVDDECNRVAVLRRSGIAEIWEVSSGRMFPVFDAAREQNAEVSLFLRINVTSRPVSTI